MFCQKCGKTVPEGEEVILDNFLFCKECADLQKRKFCDRCGCEISGDTAVQKGDRLLCQSCAELPDDSKDVKPFQSGKPAGKEPEQVWMLPVWGTVGVIVLVAAIILGLFVTKTLCIHKWEPATCEAAEYCLKCGRTHGDPLPHRWVEPDCLHPRTCTVCGRTEGEPLRHDWLEAGCTEPQVCARCGETQGKPAGHHWENATCEHPRRCTECGLEQGEPAEHQWLDATCEEPKTCMVCGLTSGVPLGHKWTPATCTAKKTCSVCGKQTGKPKGHQWKLATLLEPSTCEICGRTIGTPLKLENLLPIDLMQVPKEEFVQAVGDAHHERLGCSKCSGSPDTLVSAAFPGCVIAYGEASDSLPVHIHVTEGAVMPEIRLGMTYQELSDALGEPYWKVSAGDLSASACYTIGGRTLSFVFTDLQMFSDAAAGQLGRKNVTVKHPELQFTSVLIE